jgi:hypothetical protein
MTTAIFNGEPLQLDAPELLSALRLTVSLLSRASGAGALYGKHDVEWLAMRDAVQGVISKTEGRVAE